MLALAALFKHSLIAAAAVPIVTDAAAVLPDS